MPTPAPRLTARQASQLLAERERRKTEGLALYRPRPEQLPFHLSRAAVRVVKGGNRSGKTACAAGEVASAALRQPLIRADGHRLPYPYPRRALVIWMIGIEQPQIARMGRKLFSPGLFRCVKDPKTGKLRPWKGYEKERGLADQTVPSPPLIPARAIKGWKPGKSWKDAKGVAWENRAKGVFSSVELKNGTIIYAYPSGTLAAIGDAVDLIWVDEDVKDPNIIPELQARLADVEGRLVWSTWARQSNDALLKLNDAADEEEGKPDADPFRINLVYTKNPFISPDQRAKLVKLWKQQGEAVWRARDLGEFQTDRVRVFPTFNQKVHCLPTVETAEETSDPLERYLFAHDWEVPPEWTWHLGIDPGHTKGAAVPVVVPPPSIGDYVLVPGEVYLEIFDAEDLASVVRQRWPGVRWETFVMDPRAGRQTGIGTSTKTIMHYERAFELEGLRCRSTDHHIAFGLDVPTDRNQTIRNWLRPRADGTYKLRLIGNQTPQLQREFRLYQKKVDKDDVKEDVIRKHNDCIDALGYVVSYGVKWVDEAEDQEWQAPNAFDQMIRDFEKRTLNREQAPPGAFSMGAGAAGALVGTWD